MSEKHVKVVVLIDFSYKRCFFCLSNDFRVKFGFYVVFDGKGSFFGGLTILFLMDAGSEKFRV